MKADLLKSRRLLNTWKTGFAIKASQCSSHLHWNKPWIQTFWSNCSSTQCWLTRPEHIFTCEICSITNQKTPQHLEKMVSPWRQFNVLAMLLYHTMNTHFLSPPQWHTVLIGSTRIPVHPRNMLYNGPQDTSKPRKPVLPWTSIGILAIFSGSSHDYTHFSPIVAQSDDWFHLDTLSSMRDALPRTRRHINTWKTGFAIKASQCSGHLCWIKPFLTGSMGGLVFWRSQSGLYATAVGSESVYSWCDPITWPEHWIAVSSMFKPK